MSANDGYVYLVKLPIRNLYKIGRTQSPTVRVKGYGLGSKMLICVLCPAYKTVERKLRDKYKSKLVKGREWFNFGVVQVKEITEFLSVEVQLQGVEVQVQEQQLSVAAQTMPTLRPFLVSLGGIALDGELRKNIVNIRRLWETLDTFLLSIQIKQNQALSC